jgi:Flp pilus assembly protein TadD
MRRGLGLWSAIIAFQIVSGVAVFLITRQIYQDQPLATGQSQDVSQAPTLGVPHPVPEGMARNRQNTSAVSLPGSERFTLEDAQRLVVNRVGGDSSATSASPEELSRVADRHFREGLFQQAAAEYARVLEQAPRNVEVYNNLGLTLHYVGRSDEAVEVLEKGIVVDATHQRIWLTLGFVQSSLGDVAAARRSLSTAAELDSDSTVGREAKRLLDSLP